MKTIGIFALFHQRMLSTRRHVGIQSNPNEQGYPVPSSTFEFSRDKTICATPALGFETLQVGELNMLERLDETRFK